MHKTSRRRLLAAVPLLAAALVLTACTSEGSDDAGGDLNVVIDQRFGKAEITTRPERVVALNQQSVDTVLAFGVQPVGYVEDGLEFPWQKDKLDKEPEAGLSPGGGSTELNFELIASLEPDLIVAGYSAFDQETFDKLTAIAPTIGPIEAESLSSEPWQNITTAVGKALGQADEAAEMISATEASIAAMQTDIPGLKGKTYSFVNFAQGQIYVPLEGDGASTLFKEMGLELAPGLKSIDTDDPRTILSAEQLSLLDGDIMLAVAGSPEDRPKVEGDSRYAGLPAVKNGTVLWFELPTIYGLDTPSLLSIPYCLDFIKPTLETAARSA